MVRYSRRFARLVAFLTIVLVWPSLSHALTDEEIFREFHFNFANPGARALGMGGAFAAVADDATATQANPAGLRYVLTPEFFLGFRSGQQDTTVTRSNMGSLAVDPGTGGRELPFLGLTSVSSPEAMREPGFLSFVLPLRRAGAGRRVRIAGSRQVILSEDKALASDSSVTEARFAFDSFPNTVSGSTVEAYSVDSIVSGDSSMDMVYWNVGGGVDLTPDFSAGLTLTYATLDLRADTQTEVVDPLQLFLDPTHPRRPVQPSVDLYRTTIDGNDSDVTFTFGIHLHPDSVFASGVSPWRFGAVYRRGASFAVSEMTYLNELPDRTFENTIIVPDRYSLAASYRSPVHWLVSLEIERVEYSDLMEGFESGVNYLTGGQVAGGAFGIDPNRTVEFTVDDGIIPRAGVEYILWPGSRGGRRLALWGGYFRTPDDRIRMSRFNSDDPGVNAVYLEAFRGGQERNHFTAGVGYTLGRASFQLSGEASSQGHQVVGACAFKVGRNP